MLKNRTFLWFCLGCWKRAKSGSASSCRGLIWRSALSVLRWGFSAGLTQSIPRNLRGVLFESALVFLFCWKVLCALKKWRQKVTRNRIFCWGNVRIDRRVSVIAISLEGTVKCKPWADLIVAYINIGNPIISATTSSFAKVHFKGGHCLMYFWETYLIKTLNLNWRTQNS